jgi:hypothetical protein
LPGVAINTSGKVGSGMMRVLACCILLLGVLTNQALADDVFNHPQTVTQLLQGPLQQPSNSLRDAQLMRGKFVFKKYLPEIPKPIVSHGTFVFVKELGVDWHTREPFDSDFVLTLQGMRQIDAGKTTMQMNASEQPAVRIIAQIFLSLLSLDVQALQNSFSLYGVQQGRQWQVGLKPTVPAIANVFRDAIVNGAAQVDTLTLHDANGDRTEIEFSDVQYQTQITAEERGVFAKQ